MAKEYIEREAAIKRFSFAKLDCLGMEPTIRAADVVAALESIPAADVKEIIRVKWRQGVYAGYRCPVCITTWEAPTNYCPNCGADMRESGQ